MRVRAHLKNLCVRALAESMDVKRMVVLARRLFGTYDLHARSHYPTSVPIPNREVARQILEDAIEADMFLDFVSLIIDVDRRGLSGRKFRIPRIEDILTEVLESGFSYDEETGKFVENPHQRKTKNWGILRERQYYMFAFLRCDLVGNSDLVRDNHADLVEATYRDVREIVQKSVEKRDGRLWSWEGDGGLAAFYKGDIHGYAVHAGMEILHELLVYNAAFNRLSRPLQMRLAAHGGEVQYRFKYSDIKSDVIKQATEIESSYTDPDCLTVSEMVYRSLDPIVSAWFVPMDGPRRTALYRYRLKLERTAEQPVQ